MRKALIAVVSLIALFGVLLLLLPRILNVDQYRAQLQTMAEKKLKRKVTLGEMKLKIFPLAVRIEGVTISDDPAFPNPEPFIKADELFASMKLLPLLHKEVDVQLEITKPNVVVMRDKDGVWNFASFASSLSSGSSSSSSLPVTLDINSLQIADGVLAFSDSFPAKPLKRYEHVNLKVTEYTANKPFGVDVSVTLPDGENSQVALRGVGGPINKTDIMLTPLNTQLELDNVTIAYLRELTGAVQLKDYNGSLSLHASVKNDQKRITSAGTIHIDGGKIQAVDIGYPLELDYALTFEAGAQAIAISKGDLKLGATPVSLTGDVNMLASPTIIDLHAKTQGASIAEVARLASAFGVAFSKDVQVAGKISTDIHAQGPITGPTFDGKLSGSDLNITGRLIPQTVRIPAVELALTSQEIQSNDFAITAGSTTVNAQLAVQNYTGPAPALKATVKLPNGKVEELLGIAKAVGVSQIGDLSGTGALTLDVQASGPIKNISAIQISGSGSLNNAVLKMPSIIKKPVEVPHAAVSFSPSTISIADLSAKVGSTVVTGSASVQNYNGNSPMAKANVKLPNGKIEELLEIAKSVGLDKVIGDFSGTGGMSLDVHAEGPIKNMAAMQLSGTGSIFGAVLKMPSMLTKPAEITRANVKFTLTSGTISEFAGKLGSMSASGRLTVQNFSAPNLNFALTADKLNIAEAMAWLPSGPAKTSPQAASQAGAPSFVKLISGGGTLSVGSIVNDQIELKDAKTTVSFDKGVIKMNPLVAKIFGGTHNGSITLDMSSQKFSYTINSKLDSVDTNQLLSATTSVKQLIYGLLAGAANASFTGSTPDEIAKSLNGDLAINMHDGKLMRVDLVNELSMIGQFMNPAQKASGQPFTNIVVLTGNLAVKNGVANTTNLSVTLPLNIKLDGTGLIDLVSQKLDLKILATLPKELTARIQGTKAAGYMNTILADKNGNLLIPVKISGTMDKPRVLPDLERMVNLKTGGLVDSMKKLFQKKK